MIPYQLYDVDSSNFDDLFLEMESEDGEKDSTPYDAPEMEDFKNKKLEFEREWPNLSSTITNTCPIEPKVIPIEEGVTQEHIQETAIKAVEG